MCPMFSWFKTFYFPSTANDNPDVITPCWVRDSFEFVRLRSNSSEVFKVNLEWAYLSVELDQKLKISLCKLLAVFGLTEPLSFAYNFFKM